MSKVYHIAAGIIRRGQEILLVQQGARDESPYWTLPGGTIESGELLPHALIREVKEETGLDVQRIGQLAYMTNTHNSYEHNQSYAFVMEVVDWSGDLLPNDPDKLIYDVRFFPQAEAILHLEGCPWRSMREPIIAYLRGDSPPAKVWVYSHSSYETFELLATLA